MCKHLIIRVAVNTGKLLYAEPYKTTPVFVLYYTVWKLVAIYWDSNLYMQYICAIWRILLLLVHAHSINTVTSINAVAYCSCTCKVATYVKWILSLAISEGIQICEH